MGLSEKVLTGWQQTLRSSMARFCSCGVFFVDAPPSSAPICTNTTFLFTKPPRRAIIRISVRQSSDLYDRSWLCVHVPWKTCRPFHGTALDNQEQIALQSAQQHSTASVGPGTHLYYTDAIFFNKRTPPSHSKDINKALQRSA